MREIDPGHVFDVDIYDGDPETVPHRYYFMKRIGSGYPGNEPPAGPGTNCQEPLRVLIRRTQYLNWQKASEYNQEILGHLRDALWSFELRHAEDRGRLAQVIKRGGEYAEGMTTLAGRPFCVESIPTCKICGHIFCEEHP